MKNKICSVVVIFLSIVGKVSAWNPSAPETKSNSKATKSLAVNCASATAVSLLDFNSARVRVENGGTLWLDRGNGTAAYEIPKGSNKRALYAGALWMGGNTEIDPMTGNPVGDIKQAAVTFRARGENDFWPGPITANGGIASADRCNVFDRFFPVSKADVIRHVAYWDADPETRAKDFPGYTPPAYFFDWAMVAKGEGSESPILGPWKNFDDDELMEYDPTKGDYPFYDLKNELVCRDQTTRVPLFGDTTLYWIFNDKGNIHTETNSEPIGMEIRAQAFAFSSQNAVNNMTFYNYVLVNQATEPLYDTYFGQWADADLGNPNDDYVGCDVSRGLGFAYNGDNDDDENGGPAPGYGATPPAIGIDFFQGPFKDKDGLDNYGPYDEKFAPKGDSTGVTYAKAKQGFGNLGKDGIPYIGLGIGYGDGVVDNERFGMTKFLYYNIGGGANGDPTAAEHYAGYLRGIWQDGQPFYFGGNAYRTDIFQPQIECNYMFPGDTDPLNWGMKDGAQQPFNWSESNTGGQINPPGDRRFLQSSGPFTLLPGDVNNITVGVVWARASSGDALASVASMKSADDLAQSLFDNCFEVFEGPDAPIVQITELDRELILYLDNPSSSNNFGESYAKRRPEQIIDPITKEQALYEFEGYIVYQVKNEDVTVSQLADPNFARQIFQCDVKNFKVDSVKAGAGKKAVFSPISNLINYENSDLTKLPTPVLKVTGSNKGVVKSIRVKNDLFATGPDRELVNNRPYYYIAIAYGYNNFRVFNPVALDGQDEPFVPSRKNGLGGSIRSYAGIPHITSTKNNGTKLNVEYGEGLPLTRIEGVGTGGNFLEIEQETEDIIMSGAPWFANEIKYKKNAAPVNVKVVDPLRIVENNFELKLLAKSGPAVDTARWELKNLDNGEVTTSAGSILVGAEELLLKYGISITFSQQPYRFSTPSDKATDVGAFTSFIGGTIQYKDSLNPWLSGISDVNSPPTSPFNWIRNGAEPTDNKAFESTDDGTYTNILGRTWTPFAYVDNNVVTAGGPNQVIDIGHVLGGGPEFEQTTVAKALALLPNVDIVLTSDKSKWTRCPVLESSDDLAFTPALRKKSRPKDKASVDKNGIPFDNPNCNKAEAGLVSEVGMGWFPGYAINVETGERLNIAFGEDSYLSVEDEFEDVDKNQNGNDMIWNPTSSILETLPSIRTQNDTLTPVFGGRHYIWIFRNNQRNAQYRVDASKSNPRLAPFDTTQIGAYDEGRKLMQQFAGSERLPDRRTPQKRNVWDAATWTTIPILAPGAKLKSIEEGLIPNDVRIKLRVAKRFEQYPSNLDRSPIDTTGSLNNWYPLYRFNTGNFAPEFNVNASNEDFKNRNLDIMRAVPNPYYAFSSYESTNLDNRIKLTNLPRECKISIYTLDGTLIRSFNKSNESTIVEWDLKNFANIPISSGTYLIHINVPGLGERVIKWFGVMRQVDLQNK